MLGATRQAIVCGALGAGWLFGAAVLWLGPPRSGGGAGEAAGWLLALSGFAAVATWSLARRRPRAWPVRRFVSTYVLALLALTLLAAFGRAGAAPTSDWPLDLELPPEWNGERLEGLSSAPQDHARGRRLRWRWQGQDGVAAIEFSCGWIAPGSGGDPAAQLAEVQGGVAAGLAEQGLETTLSQIVPQRRGARTWQVTEIIAHDDTGPLLRQRIAMANSDECALTAVLAGVPAAFERQLPTFEQALERLRSR